MSGPSRAALVYGARASQLSNMATPLDVQGSIDVRAANSETPMDQGLFVVPLAATVCSMIVAIISLTLLSAFFGSSALL